MCSAIETRTHTNNLPYQFGCAAGLFILAKSAKKSITYAVIKTNPGYAKRKFAPQTIEENKVINEFILGAFGSILGIGITKACYDTIK